MEPTSRLTKAALVRIFHHGTACAPLAVALAIVAMAGCEMDPDTESENSTEATIVSRSGAVSCRGLPAPPPELDVPAGNRLASSFDAVGVQIYKCSATDLGFAWIFQAPEATLLNPGGQIAGTHFAGPTWQTNDGSAVVGTRVAAVTVDATAIPWLLLSAASHSGHGRMADVSFIQRLDTVGGLAPSTGCDAGHVDTVSRVDYQAKYLFYKPSGGPPVGSDCK